MVPSSACSVPVYRYALERWPADPFEALVYHRGEPSDAAVQEIAMIRESSAAANLKYRLIDLDTEADSDLIGLWEDEDTATLPWVVLTYPGAYPFLGPVASGPLTEETVRGFTISPARREIAERIAGGQTGVWVLLESGDEERDAAVASLLEARLEYLESHLKLPTLEQEDIDAGLVSISQDELKVDFSMFRISRDDTEEEVLVEMLVDSEEDLSDHEAPIVFPVFGRGRVLHALIGDGIHAGTIDEAAEYVVGACSCQVKEQNPGVDLLIAMDWDDAIGAPAVVEKDLPPLEGAGIVSTKVDSAPERVVAGHENEPVSAVTGGDPAESRFVPKIVFWIILAVFLVVAAGSLFILSRNPNRG